MGPSKWDQETLTYTSNSIDCVTKAGTYDVLVDGEKTTTVTVNPGIKRVNNFIKCLM